MRAYSIEPVFGLATLRITIPGRTTAVATIHQDEDGCLTVFPVEPSLLPDTRGMPISFRDLASVEVFLGIREDVMEAAA